MTVLSPSSPATHFTALGHYVLPYDVALLDCCLGRRSVSVQALLPHFMLYTGERDISVLSSKSPSSAVSIKVYSDCGPSY